MVRVPKQRPKNAVATRLRQLRAAYEPGVSASAFARKYGFGVNQWLNFENGHSLPITAAAKLRRQIPGLTLDWIYEGEMAGLSYRMAELLRPHSVVALG